jgi:hypothetical protein
MIRARERAPAGGFGDVAMRARLGMLRKMPANDRHWVDVWVSR